MTDNEELYQWLEQQIICYFAITGGGTFLIYYDMVRKIKQSLDAKDSENAKLKEKLSNYADCYNASKSGLRADEVHCACAYELQAENKDLNRKLKESALQVAWLREALLPLASFLIEKEQEEVASADDYIHKVALLKSDIRKAQKALSTLQTLLKETEAKP